MTNAAALVAEVRGHVAEGRTRSLEWRCAQLERLAELMEERETELLDALAADLGKPRLEGWSGETGLVASEARYARRRLQRWAKPRSVSTPLVAMPARSWLQPEPLGVVLIIGAWNYPVNGVLSPAVSAIAAGNAVILKPSELAPATSAALARWIPRYLDPEVIRVFEGGVEQATELLHERFDHIVYTGSGRVGRTVMQAAAEHLTPVTLELGGKSPCIVLADADIETAARRIAWGKFLNAGQLCIAPDYVLTDAATEPRLIEALRRQIHSMFGAYPDASPDFGRIVNARHFHRIMTLMREGGRVVIGGECDEANRYIAPTVLADVTDAAPIMHQEIFGPVLPIVRSSSLQTSIDYVRKRPKPLSAYLFSRSAVSERNFLEGVAAGMVCINDVLMFTTVPELPHGGVGESGMGAFKGRAGFDRLSHLKVVMRRSLWPDADLRYAPYSEKKMRALRRLR